MDMTVRSGSVRDGEWDDAGVLLDRTPETEERILSPLLTSVWPSLS